MIDLPVYACARCDTACFCDTDPNNPDNWPRCLSCGQDMTPKEDD